ncbi:uncharacterized protein LOC108155555 [Drosophila miranda]|uniref:uncharacterized protein LOC108155555 n=1 Tax=Drosophila miranda TaxID=7229 RepID=UPI0007E882E7|nr:uncharacterized protein LOC108155555 [Drosophila miranda]
MPGMGRLSALIELVNIAERLDQSDVVSELAKSISDETEPPLTSISDCLLADPLSGPFGQATDKLLDQVDPQRTATTFRSILKDLRKRRPSDHTGGLYDYYQKIFSQALSEQSPATSEGNSPMEWNEMGSCRCENSKPAMLAADQGQMQAKKQTRQRVVDKLSGAPRIRQSRIRQLVWNEVPLIEPGLSSEPHKMTKKARLYNENKGLKARPSPAEDPIHFVIKQSSLYGLIDAYQRQMQSLRQSLHSKHDWWKEVIDRGLAPGYSPSKRYAIAAPDDPVSFPEELANQADMASEPQIGGNSIDNMASQMNMSPMELFQRIMGSNMGSIVRQGQAGHQIGGGQAGSLTLNALRKSKLPQETFIEDPQPQEQPAQDPPIQRPSKTDSRAQDPSSLGPVLDKILQRLDTLQESKCSNDTGNEKDLDDLSCCFTDPADGAPCDIIGSWESLVLGVRINIRAPKKSKSAEGEKNPACYSPKLDISRRECVKINPSQPKDRADSKKEELMPSDQMINVTVQETVPPRAHVIVENLDDWDFSGHTLGVLGGPVSLAFRKVKSNLVGNFVGYCRTCGCVDTIFGSWTFCQPSGDCQGIMMSLVDRRDLLRRYSLAERMEAESMNSQKSTPQPQLQQQESVCDEYAEAVRSHRGARPQRRRSVNTLFGNN